MEQIKEARAEPPIWATTCFACVAVGAAPKGLICSRPPAASCAVSGDESHPAAWGRGLRTSVVYERSATRIQPAPRAVGLLRVQGVPASGGV